MNTLLSEFLSLEELVSKHDDPSDFSTSAPLAEWIPRIDHIQKAHEEELTSEVDRFRYFGEEQSMNDANQP